eukprot:7623020-Pyramimonas_sp.AAC.1
MGRRGGPPGITATWIKSRLDRDSERRCGGNFGGEAAWRRQRQDYSDGAAYSGTSVIAVGYLRRWRRDAQTHWSEQYFTEFKKNHNAQTSLVMKALATDIPNTLDIGLLVMRSL